MSPWQASARPTESWNNFRFSLDRGIATVTFDRPEVLNALTFEVYADLRDLLTELALRTDVKVLVMTGTGRGFCSGGDVHEIIGTLVEKEARELLEFTRMTGAVVQRMRDLPIPIIASINGVAAGAGAVIALAADFRLCAESATFAFLFTKVGLAGADMGSAYLLPRIVGFGRATELLLLGENVDSARAQEIGLAYKVVPNGELVAATMELAEKLEAGPTFAYAATKALLSREMDTDLASALELEAMTQALLMQTRDHREFYKAFTEGRQPDWRGR